MKLVINAPAMAQSKHDTNNTRCVEFKVAVIEIRLYEFY